MAKLVECIPNFSEGRNEALINEFADAVKSTPGVMLLDFSRDASHNRSVFTFAGSPEGVLDAVFKTAKIAVEKIDLTKHSGEHPRMGAVDVIPFVPLKEITTGECVEMSRTLGKKLWDELKLPVFLYEDSATTPERRNLAALRKGQFEGMAEKIKKPEFVPDYGNELHRTAGIVACGARPPLIAFNVNLATSDIEIANKIAKIIRESSGGLKSVKSIGIKLEERNIAQVSINMTNYMQTPLYRVLELVKVEAARYGVSVLGTEIVGLVPMNALVDCADYYLMIENFDSGKQVLENHLIQG
ncbi:MAG: glutamate formimidoyltransferase [Treponema sp.]|jgi:glutamate formiminotransferase|nr:glutamate formimidoyltransferase [Treponema sp.]